MTPSEQEALSKAHKPWNRGLWAMALSTVLIIISLLIFGSSQKGMLQHFLGQSEKTTATVTNKDEVSLCTL